VSTPSVPCVTHYHRTIAWTQCIAHTAFHFALPAGHSFPGEQFLAKVSIALPGHRLTFPACHLGDSVYQTLRLTNHAKLPASFNFHVPPGAAFA
jgi:hypothetical protein